MPVTVVVGILLASADENFASLFGLADAPTIVTHVLLFVSGAIGTAALIRTALTARRAPTPRTRTIGPTEASVVLATLVGVYTLFVVARVVHAATDAPVEQLADEARAGFFQLVAVVVITVAVLCGARALVSVRSRPFIFLASSLAVLTLAIDWVALVRLDRYRNEFGLTQLRLATTWFSVWLAVVVIVVACSFLVRHLRWLHFVAAVALVWLVAWNVHNPDHHIAATNLDRAVTGARFDADFVAGLSEDAIPAIVTRIDDLLQHNATPYTTPCAPNPPLMATAQWHGTLPAPAVARP